MTTDVRESLTARNPSTGQELARIEVIHPGEVSGLVAGAKQTQTGWSATPIRRRVEVVRRWWSILSRDADLLARAIRDEIGKPLPEARMEVVATLDALRWTVKNARRVLAEERVGPGWQRMALMGPARLQWRPVGVVGIIGTWNYPVLLDAAAMAQALVAGNGVAWKPSENCALVGSLLRDRLAEAGVPPGLVATLLGGPEVGAALVASDINKAVFTGGITNGRRILTALSERGIPAVAELSGFDPAIVLTDAPRESTARALTWAAFVGAGQTCVAVKRVYVVGDDARSWAEDLADHARSLRVSDPASDAVDLGPMISPEARSRFHRTIRETIAAGARVVCGGEPVEGPGAFYRPTVLIADDEVPEIALEGAFGPVVLVRGVADDLAAIAAANGRSFGLAASVWGRDRGRARSVADRLEAGMVTINDAVTPSGLAAAPFGGVKTSGYGRTRGALGLREFVQPRTVSERGPGGFRPHLFPYSPRLGSILAFYRRLFHPSA